MRLEQLRQLKVLEEQRSISKAAKALFISQPALSMSLSSLEEELGVVLFARSAQGIEPSPVERQISGFVQEILQDVGQLERLRERYSDGLEETAIAAAPACYDEVLMRVLALKRSHPQLRVEVRSLDEGKLLDGVSSGQCDIAVAEYRPDQWRLVRTQLKSKGISYELLMERSLQVCLPLEDELAAKRQMEMTDLRDRPLVVLREHVALLDKHCKRHGLERKNWLIVDDCEVQKKLVADGIGLGIGFYGGCEDDPYFALGLLALREMLGLDKAMSYLLFDKQRCVSTAKEQILQYLQNGEG